MSATPSSYYTAFIRGDSCLPQTGLCLNPFRHRGMDRVSSRVLWSLLFSSWNNPHARVAHLGVSCPEPHYDPWGVPTRGFPCHEQVIELCVFLHLPILSSFLFPGFLWSSEAKSGSKKHKGSPQQRPLQACPGSLPAPAVWGRMAPTGALTSLLLLVTFTGRNRYPGDTSLALELLSDLSNSVNLRWRCCVFLSNRLISHIKRKASCISGFWNRHLTFCHDYFGEKKVIFRIY